MGLQANKWRPVTERETPPDGIEYTITPDLERASEAARKVIRANFGAVKSDGLVVDDVEWESLTAAQQDSLRQQGYRPAGDIQHPETSGPEFYDIGPKADGVLS